MQFHEVDETDILRKMIYTLQTTYIIPNNNPKCTVQIIWIKWMTRNQDF